MFYKWFLHIDEFKTLQHIAFSQIPKDILRIFDSVQFKTRTDDTVMYFLFIVRRYLSSKCP
jgi:hypothetical protein